MVSIRVFLSKIITIISLVFLTSCQVFNGFSGQGSIQATPLPLTGDKASAAGASALLVMHNPKDVGYVLIPVSADTGKPVAGFAPILLGLSSTYAFSSDREQMAIASSSLASCSTTCLQVLNLRTWHEDIQPILLPNNFADSIRLTFDRSGKMIAVFIDSNAGNGGQLLLVDLTQGKIVQKVDLSSNVFQMAFTPDGSLALYGNLTPQPKKTTIMYVTLFDIPSLQVKWHQDLAMVSFGDETLFDATDPSQGQYLNPAAVFSNDQSRLYVVAADKPRLVTVDFTGQTVQTAVIQPPQSLLEQLLDSTASVVYAKMLNGTSKSAALSADGKYLYVVGWTSTAVKDKDGNWGAQSTPLGLQVVDARNGTEVATLATTASNVNSSFDGKTILLNGADDSGNGSAQAWTDLVGAASYKVTGRLKSEILPSRLLDGSLVWLSSTWSGGGYSNLTIFNSGSQTPRSKLDDNAMNDSYWVPIP